MAAFALLLQSTAPATADFYDGLRAYDAKDYASALAEWQIWADTGDADSQYRLAALFGQGLGTPQDLVRAHLYYNLAAAQAHEEAHARRDALNASMPKVELAEARKRAAEWTPRTAPRAADALAEGAPEPVAPAPVVAEPPPIAVEEPPVVSSPPPRSPDSTVQMVQRQLAEIGYDPGPADGLMGAKTSRAIMKFERDYELEPNGTVTDRLIERLAAVTTGSPDPGGSGTDATAPVDYEALCDDYFLMGEGDPDLDMLCSVYENPYAVLWGAVAKGVDYSDNDAFYFAYNYPDADEAETNAMSSCLAEASYGCELATLITGCFAVARAPGNGWGWATQDTIETAQAMALSQCRESNTGCYLSSSFCADGSGEFFSN
ncbi:MAG: DUF4189 domain-containing protein [Alphaproteobacteria bacterium]|nr:DUF4189 domain-containing protein [Alphaproteobacteria bacterium]